MLAYHKVNNVNAEQVSPNTYRYFIDSTDTDAEIYIEAQYPNATINSDGYTGTGNLTYTKNTTEEITEIKFNIVAEDGTIIESFIIEL